MNMIISTHLPASNGVRMRHQAARIWELGRADPPRWPAGVMRVQHPIDLPVLRRVERGPVHVWGDLVHIELEYGLRLVRTHGRWKEGAVLAAMWEVPNLVVLLALRGQVSDHKLPLAVHDIREIKVPVVLALFAIQAVSPILLECVGSPHGIDELTALPLPGEVPVVKAAEGAEVVNGHLGLVVVAICG